jgi:hypothetical protein
MQWDSQLDATSAKQGGPNASYYATWSAYWAAVYADIATGPCATPAHPLWGAACTNPPAWFATAIGTHRYDEQQHPENTAWDNQWITTYTNLTSLWPTITGC